MPAQTPNPATTRLALITGASSGLGEEFANQLAGRGYDLILTARRQEKLETLAAALQARHSVQVEVIAADLARLDEQQRLAERIRALPALHLLVNNAGFGSLGKFSHLDIKRQQEMVCVHLQATIGLTHAALPAMLARRSGAIINVSSLAAFFSLPGGSIYCATKAALVNFTQTLALELQGTGVQAQVLCPGYTYTGFHETQEFSGFKRTMLPGILWGAAPGVITRSLKALEHKRVVVIPGWVNQFLAIFGRNHFFSPIVRPVIRILYLR